MAISAKIITRQGDPLGGVLFVVAHLCVVWAPLDAFPNCLFPFVVDNTHIVALVFLIRYVYIHLR